MRTTRSHYWSCSKFADWLRGTAKPKAADSTEWNIWRRRAQQAHQFRYWLAEEGLDYIQDFVMWPIDVVYSVKYYIANRWVTKTHALTGSSLKKGEWHELDTRLLHCMFDELVNHVEVELAWSHVVWDKDARKEYSVPFYGVGRWRTRTWRSPKAGLDHLAWAGALTKDESWGLVPGDPEYGNPTPQAEAAQEVAKLYDWWKNVRPHRADPYAVSGWTDMCNQRRNEDTQDDDWFLRDRTPEQEAQSRAALDKIDELERQYDEQDTEMMVRLIKIRQYLWT